MIGQQNILPTNEPLALARMDNIGIAVQNVHVVHTFYTQVLGIQTTPIGPYDTMFIGKLADIEFYVFQTSSIQRTKRTVTSYLTNPPGYDHLVFLTHDIQQIERQLLTHHVPLEDQGEMPLLDGTTGKYCRFRDPEGNLIGVMQRIRS